MSKEKSDQMPEEKSDTLSNAHRRLSPLCSLPLLECSNHNVGFLQGCAHHGYLNMNLILQLKFRGAYSVE